MTEKMTREDLEEINWLLCVFMVTQGGNMLGCKTNLDAVCSGLVFPTPAGTSGSGLCCPDGG